MAHTATRQTRVRIFCALTRRYLSRPSLPLVSRPALPDAVRLPRNFAKCRLAKSARPNPFVFRAMNFAQDYRCTFVKMCLELLQDFRCSTKFSLRVVVLQKCWVTSHAALRRAKFDGVLWVFANTTPGFLDLRVMATLLTGAGFVGMFAA